MTRRVNAPIVGIDLGTTYSLVAVLQDGRPLALPNALGELLTPSAVAVDDDGRILVGAPARARATVSPRDTALAFKRDMGTDRVYELGGRRFGPRDLSAMVLAALKQDAETALGCTIEEAVVTVPAYFGDRQRQETRDAGAIAGLRVDRIVNEPTAAALAYGLHERSREMRAVVLDLGGGTFDVTVLEILEGVIEIQSSAGDARLGGEDFLDAMVDRIAGRIREHHGSLEDDPRSLARVREACEWAKRRLTAAERTSIAIPGLAVARGRSVDVELEITRDEVESWWTAVLERLRPPIYRALRDASLAPEAVDEVLLVGGATRMPCVVRLASTLFGRMPLRNLPPDEAVAHGAAVQAALKAGDEAVEDMVVTDVAPFTLGVATSTKMGTKVVSGLFAPILERGTVLPASRVDRLYTLDDDQQRVDVGVYQGEHALCGENVHLGTYAVDGLPPGPAGSVAIDVRFTYDLNGILEVEMSIVGTGRVEHMVLEQRPGKLTRAQIASARKEMQRLKFHPRDALPNRTALARADALFVELRGIERDLLGAAIARFHAALETQDPGMIDAAREQLVSATADLTSSRG